MIINYETSSNRWLSHAMDRRPRTFIAIQIVSFATARTAFSAVSSSASVWNMLGERRTVPVGNVPSVRCAAGAQCRPHRVRMPNLRSKSDAASAGSSASKVREKTAVRPCAVEGPRR